MAAATPRGKPMPGAIEIMKRIIKNPLLTNIPFLRIKKIN
jgi:hypothetical protein